jgi:LytS/YehU family sensor histidine kinase
MNPHFIFNCINSIQHCILEQDKLVANKLLSKFSKLVRNVLENSNSEWISIQREIETLELYIEMESVRFSSQFRYSIEVDPNINTLLDNIPPLIIQPFVENAIIHGLLPMDDKQGILEIRLVKRKDKLICTIEDNGIGRERARHIKATKEENYQSMGIAITRERLSTYDILAKHHGNLELEIEDRFMDNESPGTRVIIQIPIKTIQ